MKKIISLLGFVMFTLVAFGQINFTEDQLFGGTRDAKNANTFDFGKITANSVEHEFLIPNSNKVPLTIKNVEIPDGFGVVVVDKVIQPNNAGKIIIKVFPSMINTKGDFNEQIKVNTQIESIDGTIIKQIIFTVKGSL